MSAEAYGITTFCEDIRPDRDGQVTFVGVFTTGLRVIELPATLPKLGVYVSVVVPRTDVIEKLVTKLYFPGDDPQEPSWVSEADLGEAMRDLPQLAETRPQFLDPDVDMSHKLDQNVLFSPVTIKTEGYIKVRVEIAGRLIKAGTLKVERVAPPSLDQGHTIAVDVTRNAF